MVCTGLPSADFLLGESIRTDHNCFLQLLFIPAFTDYSHFAVLPRNKRYIFLVPLFLTFCCLSEGFLTLLGITTRAKRSSYRPWGMKIYFRYVRPFNFCSLEMNHLYLKKRNKIAEISINLILHKQQNHCRKVSKE